MSENSKVVKILKDRHATRSISEEKLSEEVIADILEAARLAPSCYNKQPWRYLVLESDEARAKGVEVFSEGNRPWAGRAPLLIIGYTQEKNDCVLPGRSYHQFDLGLSVMNLMLAATEHNLVARPMAGFDPEKAKELFGLAEEDQPLIMLAIGKPSEDEDHLAEHYRGLDSKARERKPLEEIAQRL